MTHKNVQMLDGDEQIVVPDHKAISLSVKRQFNEVKEHIKDLPIYDSDTFMKIQAFEWLITATSLVHGDVEEKDKEVVELK